MYIYGAGGHAKVVLDILESQGKKIIGIIDDHSNAVSLLKHPIYKEVMDRTASLIIAIGDNATRKAIVTKLHDIHYDKAIAKSAEVSEYATIDEGTVVMQGAIIQSCAHIGRHCIVNTGAAIDHDCVVGDFVHIAPHSTLCGNVIVGKETFIGAGTTVVPGITIGKRVRVYAGSTIVNDIPDNVVVAGTPAKIITPD